MNIYCFIMVGVLVIVQVSYLVVIFVVLVLVMNFVIGGGVYMVYDAEIGCAVGVVAVVGLVEDVALIVKMLTVAIIVYLLLVLVIVVVDLVGVLVVGLFMYFARCLKLRST